jgi:hypothetical protein
MECEVEFTDEFEAWWNGLSEGEQEDVSAVVGVLEEKGPSLRRPHVGSIASSRHPNYEGIDRTTCRKTLQNTFCF